MAKDYLLAIDNGTQSIRALVFDLEGQLVAKSKVDIEPYFSKQAGWAEQDPQYFWQQLCKACQQLWPMLAFPKSHIKAVALTTQRATLINLDRQGKPLRPAIIWLDQRETDTPKNLKGPWKYLIKAAGSEEILRYYRKQAECNWIAENQPNIWRKTHKFVLLSGYHTYQLTGQYADSTAAQVGYIPFDFKRLKWAGKRDWKWQALAVEHQQLPKLYAPGTTIGTITPQAAKLTGITEGLPLISAGADKACEVIGSGCVSPSMGSLSYGTTATFNTTSSKYLEAIPMLPPYPAAIPNHYNTEIIVQRGYWMVNWFKREFAQQEEQWAKERGVAIESLFEDMLNEVPAGSMGLVLQPYWSPGVRIPGPEAKGAIIGFGDVHTRAHIYRAIIEGLAYALREGKERVEKRSGVKVDQLRVSGGGSQSDHAMQITADIFGMPAQRPHTFETSGLGAAINAAVGAGFYPNHNAAIQRMTHPGKRFSPNPNNQLLYNQIYQDVYQKIYPNLAPLYQAIRTITGYPA